MALVIDFHASLKVRDHRQKPVRYGQVSPVQATHHQRGKTLTPDEAHSEVEETARYTRTEREIDSRRSLAIFRVGRHPECKPDLSIPP